MLNCRQTTEKKKDKENKTMKNRMMKTVCVSVCAAIFLMSEQAALAEVSAAWETETKNLNPVETPGGIADFKKRRCEYYNSRKQRSASPGKEISCISDFPCGKCSRRRIHTIYTQSKL